MIGEIPITFKTSARAKRMRISVGPDGQVVATRPIRADLGALQAFVRSKWDWIQAAVKRNVGHPFAQGYGGAKRPGHPHIRHTKKQYAAYRIQAKELVMARLEHFNQHYGLAYNRVFIKNQKTRWGSCSARGNLNFSYRILWLPPHLQDYLVVHELCHLAQMNHGPKFWELVGQQIPDYKCHRNDLRKSTLTY